MTVCGAVGILADIIHIVVLTRPSMRSNTVNRLVGFAKCEEKRFVQFALMCVNHLVQSVEWYIYFYACEPSFRHGGYTFFWCIYTVVTEVLE